MLVGQYGPLGETKRVSRRGRRGWAKCRGGGRLTAAADSAVAKARVLMRAAQREHWWASSLLESDGGRCVESFAERAAD